MRSRHPTARVTPITMMRLHLAGLLVPATLALLLWLGLPDTASSHASVEQTEPAANTAVTTSPRRVRLWFAEPVERRFTSIGIADANGRTIPTSDLRLEGPDGRIASVAVPELPAGTYTVKWRNVSREDGHPLEGAFVFAVGTTPPAAALPNGSALPAAAPSGLIPAAVIRALNFLLVALVTGAFGFQLLVLEPALRRAAHGAVGSPPGLEPPLDHRAEGPPPAGRQGVALQNPASELAVADAQLLSQASYRLITVVRVALALLVVASVALLWMQAVAATDAPLFAALGEPLAETLSTRFGGVWLVRIGFITLLTALAALGKRVWRYDWPWVAGLTLGGVVLFTFSMTSHGAASHHAGDPAVLALDSGHGLHALLMIGASVVWFIAIRPKGERGWIWLLPATLPVLVALFSGLPVVLDWIHLVAMSLWVGGLVALVVTVGPVLRKLPGPEQDVLASRLIPAFTRLALPCVLLLVGTGVYAAVIHVKHVSALTGSAYGLALLAKLVLILPLLALGASNLYLGSSKLRAILQRSPASRGMGGMAQRLLSRVRAEVLLVTLVLLATGFLTSLAPTDDAQGLGTPPGQSRLAETPQGTISLTVSPAVSGTNTIDVSLTDGGRPVLNSSKVMVRYSLPDRGIAESETVATPKGEGRYSVVGPQLNA
ncbi:MAG: copper resistance protein CopC/CopD, partial [Chloroflexota bacterium]|nr:copper resistance protein CopC/CopD [Chloroflexota bacterium]